MVLVISYVLRQYLEEILERDEIIKPVCKSCDHDLVAITTKPLNSDG